MHIHIPDGVLPVWLWLIGFVLVILIALVVFPLIKKEMKKISLAAMVLALLLIIMSIPLGLPVHMNFIVLAGLLVGGAWSFLISLGANVILATFAHGALSVVGLNTLLLWFQAIFGIILFQFLTKFFKNFFAAAAISTLVSISLSFLFLIGVTSAARFNPADFVFEEEVGEEKSSISASLEKTSFSLPVFLSLATPLFAVGAILESILTGFIVYFLHRAKPSLLSKGQ